MPSLLTKITTAASCCLDPSNSVVIHTSGEEQEEEQTDDLTNCFANTAGKMSSTNGNENAKNDATMNGNSSTYEHQSSLPRLPIPSLEFTLNKFISTVEPLLTPAQLQQTQQIVQDFGKSAGPKLQQILEEYDQEGASKKSFGSYIEEFWTEAYLAPNASVVLNLNPFFLLEDDPDAKIAKSQILRGASLTFHSLRLAASLKNETLKPDKFKSVTLCMDQFRSLFGTARIPNEDRDEVEVDLDSDHVVVLYRNQFYYFRALWPRNVQGQVTVAVSEADIAEILQSIVNDGKKQDWAESIEGAIGVFTTLPRNEWAKARYQLVHGSESNKSALEVIDSALFVLVLDDFYPDSVHDAAANMLHGTHVMKELKDFDSDANANVNANGGLGHVSTSMTMTNSAHDLNPSNNDKASQSGLIREYQAGTCCNRWYDKLQIIVCSDGSAGINFEHSSIDGHTALRFASDVYAESVVQFAKSITKSVYTQGCPIPSMIDAKVVRAAIGNGNGDTEALDTSPKKLYFQLAEKLKDRIFHAESALGDAVNADDTFVLEFTEFGKTFIVTNKMSPDSVVQMSIILAYYRLYGDIVCNYEPVLTKRYLHGRTEAMRSTTMKAVEMCKCFANRLASKEEKIKALREATKDHSRLVKESSEGMGVDRHLYALKCIAQKNGMKIPEFFASDAWRVLNHTVLSTSNCGNPALRLFGFGPVVPDGFGVGYVISDSRIQYSISSKHRQTKRFAHAVQQTLHEIGEMLEPQKSQSVGYHNVESKPLPKRQSAVEYADAWVDTYGDSINMEELSIAGESRSSVPRVPSNTSLVGFTKLSRGSLVRGNGLSIGTQIPDQK